MAIKKILSAFSEVVDQNRRWMPDWYGWFSDFVTSLEASIGALETSFDELNALVAKTVCVTSQFDKTDTTLANITGLSVDLVAGQTYAFHIQLYLTLDVAGGYKIAFNGGSATATAVVYSFRSSKNNSGGDSQQIQSTNFASIWGTVPVDTSVTIPIDGLITVNAAGTFIPQFAQNVASGTSSVLVGSFMSVSKVP